MDTKNNAVAVLREIGELIATYTSEEWSANGGPWLMKLEPVYGETVHANLSRYEDVVLYRCGPVVPYWFLVGKKFQTGAGPTYHALYGFNSHTIGFLGQEARKTFRWWWVPPSTKNIKKNLALGAVFFGFLSATFFMRFWNGLPFEREENFDVVWWVLSIIVTISCIHSIRQAQRKFKEVASSL